MGKRTEVDKGVISNSTRGTKTLNKIKKCAKIKKIKVVDTFVQNSPPNQVSLNLEKLERLNRGNVGTNLNIQNAQFKEIERDLDIKEFKCKDLTFDVCIYKRGDDQLQLLSCYTDGSSFNNGKVNAVAGSGVFFHKESPLNISQRITEKDGRSTNNVAEIMAIFYAIEKITSNDFANYFDGFLFHTDSSYTIKSLCRDLPNWVRNGWMTTKNEGVANKAQFLKIVEIVKKYNFKIFFKKVKAHNGIFGNEMADKLAKSAWQSPQN